MLTSTGAKLTSICPLMYMNNPLCAKKHVNNQFQQIEDLYYRQILSR